MKFKCSDHYNTFNVDINTDIDSRHPKSFCHGCYSITTRKANADKENKPFITGLNSFSWNDHYAMFV